MPWHRLPGDGWRWLGCLCFFLGGGVSGGGWVVYGRCFFFGGGVRGVLIKYGVSICFCLCWIYEDVLRFLFEGFS